MSWEIKGKDNQTKATVYALEYNGEWMGESYISVTIESPTPIAFAIGDYLMYRGERFEVNYDPGKIKSATQFAKGDAFKYENVKFNSLADELTRCDFRDVVLQDNDLHFTSLPKFTFFGGVRDLANRIQANLDKLYTGANKWSVVVSPEFQGGKELNVSVDNIKVQGALEILVNQFETYYTIKGRTITIGAAGVPAGHLFKYGKGNGLYEIEQNAEADQAIVTRLRAYGSTRNLPHRYYNSLTGADGQKLIPDNMAVQNLMLPSFPYTTQDPYIDSANKAALGIREGTIFFDGSQEGLEEIYPSIEGMTAEQLKSAGVPCNSIGALDEIVSAEQMTDNGVGEIDENETESKATPPTFKVTLKDLGFNLWDYRVAGETPVLSFKTGMLGGRDFEIVGCKKIESNGKVTGYELELNRVYDDGIKLWFPYKDYNAKAGDKFVLLHIEMPEVYIKAAAQRLKEAAEAWLAKNDYSRSVYAPKVDEIFMARQHDEAMASGGSIVSLHDTLKEGMLLLFEDEDLSINASIFIDRLTIKEGDNPVPTYEVVLKEEKTVGRLDKMQNQIDSLASGGQGGGYTAAQIRSMISAYGLTQFLSKLKDDRTKGKIASDLGFEIGNYLAGVSGGMFGIDANSGESFADVFKLYVRGKAFVETLTTVEANTLAGKHYITPGGSIKCVKVEEIRNDTDGNGVTAYRCFFLSEQDGEKTETKIIAGDQAISEMFNAKTSTTNKVSNHHYWRLVTSVNNDAYTDESDNHYGYIDLSATDCEPDSDTPKEGDVINQLGNRTDKTRQAAMIFSTVDPDSPSIKLLTGIGSGETNVEHYSLVGKDIISQGYDPAKGHAFFKCYGDMYIGDHDGSTYISYDQDAKELIAKLRLSIQSTIGDKTLGDIIEGYDASEYLRKALPQDTNITGGVILSTLLSLGYKDEAGLRHTLAGMNGGWIEELGGRTIGSWWGGGMVDLFDKYDNRLTPARANAATSLVRMDGSAYFANGNIGFCADGSGWLGNDTKGFRFSSDGTVTFGNGIQIDLNGEAKGLADSIESLLLIVNGFNNVIYPVDALGNKLPWNTAKADIHAIRSEKTFYSSEGLSALGLSGNIPGGGGGEGTDYERLDAWADYSADKSGWVLSAYLGNDLNTRVGANATSIGSILTRLTSIEGGALLNISTQGSGNAVTKIEKGGNSLIVTKGATFLTSHQTLSHIISHDTRSTSTTPANCGALLRADLKLNDDNSLRDGGSYNTQLTLRGGGSGSNFTYGDPHQIGFSASGNLWHRTGSGASSWGAWHKILDSNNYHTVLDGEYATSTDLEEFLSRDGGEMFNTDLVTNMNADLLDGVHLGGVFTNLSIAGSTLSVTIGGVTRTATITSATRLQTSRTLWGQSFNGSANVTGSLSHVGSITPSSSNSWAVGASGMFFSQMWARVFCNDYADHLYLINRNGDYNINLTIGTTNVLTVSSRLNVGIGTTTPASKLQVVGEARVSSLRIGDATITWDATNGGLKLDKGLYSTSYLSALGLGEMTDKKVTIDAGYAYDAIHILYGGINRSGFWGADWNTSAGALNVGIEPGGASQQTPLLVAYRSGTTSWFQNGDANRIFAMELQDSGGEMRFQMGGTTVLTLAQTGITATNINVTTLKVGTATIVWDASTGVLKVNGRTIMTTA